ncbi:uncharacterized protein VNE69_03205 [Vairimorpha necatrix]|uniref:Uncharacterized protein n=1 Tax=Vairimorpha necatrix TaxID=6039 RepID=A0AAX4JAQ8_9MICR
MIPSNVKDIYKNLLQAIGQFKSPAYKSFFTRKVNEDFTELKNQINNGKKSCVVKKYLEEQGDFLDVLKRQTVIYNMFYDDKNQI